MFRRLGLAVLIFAGTIAAPVAVTGAGAVSPLPLVCTAGGKILVQPSGDAAAWQISGSGSCSGDLDGVRLVTFTGTGTSDGAGLCDPVTGVVTNLDISVALTLTNLSTGRSTTLNQHWGSPATTFPLTTPFLITNGGQIGAGTMSTRIFARCGTDGTPVATYDWTMTT
jgi:hypothetical protein